MQEMARNQQAPQMRCYPVPLFIDLLMEMWRCEETVRVHSQAPIPSFALVDLSPTEMKAFLSCTAAGLQGACKGPVYLCNKVIRGSVITRPSLCTFSLFTSPILSSVPISSPPLPLPSLFHHPQTFSLSLIIIQILLLTLVDPKDLFDVVTCVYWQRREMK